MEKSLLMRVEASPTLNFLVYIQNVYLNNSYTDPTRIKFPYNSWNDEFYPNFTSTYKELWNEAIVKIAEHPSNDIQMLHCSKEWIYDQLFQPNEAGAFNQLYASFKAWWEIFAGSFSLERSIDNEKHLEIHSFLSKVLMQNNIEQQKIFNISLVYDDFSLGDVEIMPYFAVATAKEFHINRGELLIKLKKCL